MKFFIPIVTMAVALWVFFDSQKHGYSIWRGLLWAIGVFFFLIVFLPLYLVARKRKQKLTSYPSTLQGPVARTKCFYCGQGYEGDPKICPHCGQNLKM